MHINSVSVEIIAGTNDGLKPFGFEENFAPGLNILTGDNSSGKSTILSCIYYCLGMEQLMGSKGTNALSPALHQVLNYKGQNCNIYESTCSLTFTANNNKNYKLERKITSSEKIKPNEILIYDGDNIVSKFVHSERDHGDQGFYNWLAEVNGLEIFNVESSNGDSTKPLYMQNIFSLAFIEQTKGWSDIFSMMPSFGIKDPKQKVVEYALELKSLELNMQLDQIKSEKNAIKEKWVKIDSDLEYRTQASQLYLSHYNKKRPIDNKKIDSIYVAELDNKKREVKLKDKINRIKNSISESEIKIKELNEKSISSQEIVNTKDKITRSLARLISERNEISSLYDEEKFKLSRLKKSLSSTLSDIQGFQDVKKLSINRNWEKLTTSKCPVCENSVSNKKDSDLSEETIDKSIAFLRSQKSTFETYIEASQTVIDRFISSLAYYDKNIAINRTHLDSIDKDLNSPSSQAIRVELELQADLKHR